MSDFKNYIQDIVESLKSINPYQIYLFGSVAKNRQEEDSDIDIAVILDKDKMPKTFDEKLQDKVMVRNAIFDLSLEVPIDLLVYSKPEFEKLKRINNPFAFEIIKKGSLIYEKAS